MKQGVKRLLSMALALVSIVGAFVIFFNGIQPEYENLLSQQGRLASLERIAEDREVAVARVQELVGEYSGANASQLRSSISLALPLGVDMASALVQLVGLMDLSDLSLNSITPKVESAPSANSDEVVQPVGVISYEVGVTGGYNDFKNFLQRLETNTMIFDIRNLSMRPVRSGSSVLQITFTVVSYYQPI